MRHNSTCILIYLMSPVSICRAESLINPNSTNIWHYFQFIVKTKHTVLVLALFLGRLFGAGGEQPFIGSTLSSAFPLVNHPAFGAIYTAGAGRPEFGGLGSLGMSAALAAHPQLGALSGETRRPSSLLLLQPDGPSDSTTSLLVRPEWWRAAEAHGRGAATFLPSFIGFPPFFSPHIQPNHSASPIQVRTPGKNSHGPAKGTAHSACFSALSALLISAIKEYVKKIKRYLSFFFASFTSNSFQLQPRSLDEIYPFSTSAE